MNKGIKALLICCSVLSLLGMIFGGFVYGYETHALLIYAFAGIFIGAVMAIEIEPRYFKFPVFWQTILSISGCMLFAYSIHASAITYILAAIIGLFLGLTAQYWLKHVTFP